MKLSIALNVLLAVTVVFCFIAFQNTAQMAADAQAKLTNDVFTIIHQRKSVRKFTTEPVAKSDLETLLRAAMAAPTARNTQPWRFYVISDTAKVLAFADSLPHGRVLRGATAVVAVCADSNACMPAEGKMFWVQDCSAATENLLLAAEGLNLGAVWVGIHPMAARTQAVIDFLKLPAHIHPLCLVAIGHPTGEEKPKNKWKPENITWL